MKDNKFEQILTNLIEEAEGLESDDYLKEEIMKAAVKATKKIISDKKKELKAMCNTMFKNFPETVEEMKKEFPEYFDSVKTRYYITGIEATKAAWDGTKVRRAVWSITKPEISYITGNGKAIAQYCNCGECCGLYVFCDEDENATDWYVVE